MTWKRTTWKRTRTIDGKIWKFVSQHKTKAKAKSVQMNILTHYGRKPRILHDKNQTYPYALYGTTR